MIPSLLITFRETLEATLVVGILLTILSKSKRLAFTMYVWGGVTVGIGLSVLLATVLNAVFGGLSGMTEELFEGTLMFVTVGFLTWMILWIHREKDVADRIRKQANDHVATGYGWGLFFLSASAVVREGIETVLYLAASSLTGTTGQLSGAVIGVVAAVLLGSAIFRSAVRVNLSLLFNITTVFLLLFAAGLVAHGVHEFQEAGILPVFAIDPVWDISGIMDHGTFPGNFLRTLFGYTSTPTLVEILAYGGYMAFILMILQRNSSDGSVRPVVDGVGKQRERVTTIHQDLLLIR